MGCLGHAEAHRAPLPSATLGVAETAVAPVTRVETKFYKAVFDIHKRSVVTWLDHRRDGGESIELELVQGLKIIEGPEVCAQPKSPVALRDHEDRALEVAVRETLSPSCLLDLPL